MLLLGVVAARQRVKLAGVRAIDENIWLSGGQSIEHGLVKRLAGVAACADGLEAGGGHFFKGREVLPRNRPRSGGGRRFESW